MEFTNPNTKKREAIKKAKADKKAGKSQGQRLANIEEILGI